ncbi:MAG: hypothetical protein LUF04_02790, partial [Bacteroides sp.]|nr:hypothetical protein [Bacteroides sp.]
HFTLTIGKPQGSFTPDTHTYSVRACLEFEPQTVMENGKVLPRLAGADSQEQPYGWYYDAAHSQLHILSQADNTREITMEIH